jgi:hypothetical protein
MAIEYENQGNWRIGGHGIEELDKDIIAIENLVAKEKRSVGEIATEIIVQPPDNEE